MAYERGTLGNRSTRISTQPSPDLTTTTCTTNRSERDVNVVENPYYGDSIETSDNVYYDLDDMGFSGPRATIVTATQNVYYE